jgi:hypothetical protein
MPRWTPELRANLLAAALGESNTADARRRLERADQERAKYSRGRSNYLNQPRIPAGSPHGGEWAETPGTDGSIVVAAKKRGNEAQCDAQYRQDGIICNMIKTPLCWQRANARYAACLAGDPIPPLRF